MSDFSTELTLSVGVDSGDLRNVKQQIEDTVGTTAVGVTDGGSMSAQATGASGGRQARQLMRLAEERNEYLEDIAIYTEAIEDAVTDGALGGGGGGGGIFAELVGAPLSSSHDPR